MPCFHPRIGYRARTLNPSGKRSIVFNVNEGYKDLPVKISCGQCTGCRLERSRQWAIRCIHEASLYEKNCFITLTYSPENIPPGNTLVVEHFQKFMKRLRERERYLAQLQKREPATIRFYHCGEYGEQTARPHYHAILFNYDFDDKVFLKNTAQGHKLFTSELLSELWPKGNSSIGEMSFETAAYVARYILKKINGDDSEKHYEIVDKTTGEVTVRKKEYATCSQGLGRGWFEKYISDVYPGRMVVVRTKPGQDPVVLPPPKFYRNLLEKADPQMYESVKALSSGPIEDDPDESWERLKVRETVLLERIKQLKRSHE